MGMSEAAAVTTAETANATQMMLSTLLLVASAQLDTFASPGKWPVPEQLWPRDAVP